MPMSASVEINDIRGPLEPGDGSAPVLPGKATNAGFNAPLECLLQSLASVTLAVDWRDLSPAVHIAEQTVEPGKTGPTTVASPALRLSLTLPILVAFQDPCSLPQSPPTINNRIRPAGGQSFADRIQPLPARGSPLLVDHSTT